MNESPNKHIGWKSIVPKGIVIHYTASESLKSAYNWFMNPASKASAHVIIDHDGTIKEVVSTTDRAWHAGFSSWGGISNCNNFMLGIELVNVGTVTPITKDGKEIFITAYGDRLDGQKAYDLISKKYFEIYYEAQIKSCIKLVQEWVTKYDINPSWILGHSHVSPGRKTDPGPIFPWTLIEDQIIGTQPISGRAEIIKSIQSHLERLEFQPGSIDGKEGPATRKALTEAILDYRLLRESGIDTCIELTNNSVSKITNHSKVCNLLRRIPWKGYGEGN